MGRWENGPWALLTMWILGIVAGLSTALLISILHGRSRSTGPVERLVPAACGGDQPGRAARPVPAAAGGGNDQAEGRRE